MNYKIVFKILGYVLIVEGVFMIPSVVVSLIYDRKDLAAFLVTIGLLLAAGFVLTTLKPKTSTVYAKDGFAIVAFSWILISAFGALPFFFSGSIPSFVDCFYETVSGFTTCGASILQNVEAMPRGLLFWRSFTNWLGGMGVLVLLVALLPSLGAKSFFIVKAESPGPSAGRILPRMSDTAKIMYLIYIIMTAAMAACLLFAGMPLYDTLIHTFATAGTGGFSSMNTSVGAYNSAAIDVIITVFMILFGVNFMLYYLIATRNFRRAVKSEELRLYLAMFAGATILIMFNISSLFGGNLWTSLRYSAFQVATIMSTTGFSTTNFDLWPDLSKMILMVLMVAGGCASSTGGGMKQIRLLLLVKALAHEIKRIVHPRAVNSVTVDGKNVDEDTIREVLVFFFGYVFTIVVACFIISLDNIDLVSTFSAVLANIGNVGPGFGLVGPMSNYGSLSDVSKITLSVCMLLGRLEIFPIIVLLVPSIWLKKSV